MNHDTPPPSEPPEPLELPEPPEEGLPSSESDRPSPMSADDTAAREADHEPVLEPTRASIHEQADVDVDSEVIEAGSDQLLQEEAAVHAELDSQGHAQDYASTPPTSDTRKDAKRKKRRRRRRRDPSPRFLVIAFCMWLLGAWFISLRSADLVQPIRWMVICCVISIMAFWPVLRLSQWRQLGDTADNGSADSYRSPGRIFIDWLSLNLVFQTIIWPLHLNAQWHLDQTLWIITAIASWSLITGAIIAMGCRSDRMSHRIFATVLCLLLLVGEPLLLAITGQIGLVGNGHLIFHTTPLAILWELTEQSALWIHQPWQMHVPVIAVAGAVSWLLVAVTGRWSMRSSEPSPLSPASTGSHAPDALNP